MEDTIHRFFAKVSKNLKIRCLSHSWNNSNWLGRYRHVLHYTLEAIAKPLEWANNYDGRLAPLVKAFPIVVMFLTIFSVWVEYWTLMAIGTYVGFPLDRLCLIIWWATIFGIIGFAGVVAYVREQMRGEREY